MVTKKRAKRSPGRDRVKQRQRAGPADGEILNAVGAAAMLGISERLVLQLARQGDIPGTKLGREWRFLRSALRNHVAGETEDDDVVRALSKRGVKITVGK